MQRSAFIDGLDARVTRGAVGGVVAGLVFLLANMAYATSQDLPAVAPMLGFALIVPMLHGPRSVVLGAIMFGVALYVINFQILGRLFFEWFQEGPNQLFELFIHAVYGLLLVPFFASALQRQELPQGSRRAEPGHREALTGV